MAGSEPIRVGLIGHGLAGAFIHAPLIESTPDLQIVCIATSRAETLRQRKAAPRALPDPLEACTADDVDLVVIASPNRSHFPLADAALRAGKHVVIDKPFALSTDEADRLIALADDRKRLLSVFQNRRWDGDFRAVAQAVADGELGELTLLESRWDRFRPQAEPNWRNQPEPGSGLLWDLGSHLLDQALQLLGTPDSWTSDVATQRPGAQTDDYFELTLRYGAMRCVLSASSMLAAARPRFALHGSKGSLLTYGVDPIETALRRGERPSDEGFADRLPPIPALQVDAEGNRRERQIPAGDWTGFYRDIADAIRNDRPPAVDPMQVRAGVSMLEAAHRMASTP